MSVYKVGGSSSEDSNREVQNGQSPSNDPPKNAGYVSFSMGKEIEELADKGAGSKLRECAKALKSPSMGAAKIISGGLGALFGGIGALALGKVGKSKEGFSGGYQIGERLGRVISLPFALLSGLYLIGSKLLGRKTNKGVENLKGMLDPRGVWLKNFKANVEKRLEKTKVDEEEGEEEEYVDLQNIVNADSLGISGREAEVEEDDIEEVEEEDEIHPNPLENLPDSDITPEDIGEV